MSRELVQLAAVAGQRRYWDQAWKDAVRDAARTHTLRAVGEAAGVSHARVAQIVKNS